MLPEPEVINHVDQAFVALVIVRVLLHQLFQKADLHICIVHVELFIFANFSSNYSLVWVFVINTLDDLPKCAFINGSNDLVSVADLLAWFYQVLTLLISNAILILSPDLSDGVNPLEHAHLNLFELG